MKFVEHKIDIEIDHVTAQGARAGDQILWSKHNAANKMPRYLTANKLYTVTSVTDHNYNGCGKPEYVAQFLDDHGQKSSWTGGEYDVIVQADRFYEVPKFPGCELKFETYKELDKFVTHHGHQPEDSEDGINVPLWTEMHVFRNECYLAGIR